MKPERTAECQNFRDSVAAVCRFIRREGRRLPHSVKEPRWLPQFITFMACQRCLGVTRDAAGKINGVAIAWQDWRANITTRAEREIFQWQYSDPQGDCVYWSLVLTTEPAAMQSLTRGMVDIHPEWPSLEFMAHRKGRLVRRPGLMKRILNLKPI